MEIAILGMGKLIIVFVILAIVAKTPDRHIFVEPFFDVQRWTLKDAYKILIPVTALPVLQVILAYTVPQSIPWSALFFSSICCMAASGGYYWFIKKKYGISGSLFGLEKRKLLKSGVRTANITLILLIYVFSCAGLPPASYSRTDECTILGAVVDLLTVSIFIVIGPIFEELLFRGILYVPVARKIGSWPAMACLALVEALSHFHYSPAETLGKVVIFLLLYRSYLRNESLYGPIIWHIALNFWAARSELAPYFLPYISGATLGTWIIYCLVFGLLIVNSFWLVESSRKRRLQEDRT